MRSLSLLTMPSRSIAVENLGVSTTSFGKSKSRPLIERLQILLQRLVDELALV